LYHVAVVTLHVVQEDGYMTLDMGYVQSLELARDTEECACRRRCRRQSWQRRQYGIVSCSKKAQTTFFGQIRQHPLTTKHISHSRQSIFITPGVNTKQLCTSRTKQTSITSGFTASLKGSRDGGFEYLNKTTWTTLPARRIATTPVIGGIG
jgi:hypothetical protein